MARNERDAAAVLGEANLKIAGMVLAAAGTLEKATGTTGEKDAQASADRTGKALTSLARAAEVVGRSVRFAARTSQASGPADAGSTENAEEDAEAETEAAGDDDDQDQEDASVDAMPVEELRADVRERMLRFAQARMCGFPAPVDTPRRAGAVAEAVALRGGSGAMAGG